MNYISLYSKLSQLPESLKVEVEHFIDVLLVKQKTKKSTAKKVPTFGSGKGMFIMSPDFDEPLEDFKEYME